MKSYFCIYLTCLAFFLSFGSFEVNAQTSNLCGVTANIWPAAHDSVVPLNTIISFTSKSTNATSVTWLLDGLYSGITADSWNYVVGTGVHTISLVAYNGNCSDTTTVVYFCAGTPHDIDSLLVANYGLVDTHEYGTCINNTPDGGFILGGYGVLYNCGEKGLLVKLRDRGCIDWSKYLSGTYNCDYIEVKSVYVSQDSSYYIVGTHGSQFLMKLDKNANILWSRKWEINGSQFADNLGFDKLTGDPNGFIYATSASFDGGYTVTKFDPSGNIIWNKYYQLSYYNRIDNSNNEFVNPVGILWLNGKLYVTGINFVKGGLQAYNFIAKLDASSALTEWQYGYSDDVGGIRNSSVGFREPSRYDSLIMVAGASGGAWVTLLDPQGNVVKSIRAKFNNSYSEHITKAEADSNGHIYLMQWSEQTLPLQPYFAYFTHFAKIDTSLNKYWGMEYTTYPRGYFMDAALNKDNSFAAVGMDFGFVTDAILISRDFRFIKVDTPVAGSDLNCNYNASYNLFTNVINRYNFQYFTDSFFTPNPVTLTDISVKDAYMQSRYSCPDFIDSCSFMKITGPLSMCSYFDTYTYRLHRNKKCALLPKWILPPGVTIINQTDTTIIIKFADFGVYTIASVLQSCIPVKDSLTITIKPKASNLNVGNDTIICNNSSIKLHAGPSFITYLWNDGSSDSVLTTTQPGIYWVEIVDSCGNSLRDSIIISPFNLAISIGPDRTKCSYDTLHLQAPDGFLNYTWSNNYNINSTSSQNVVINPLVDTAYYLKAEKLSGCFAYDTVRINVKTSSSINLGQDKSFCTGDSAVLNAGTGFAQYQWSNGSLTQQTTVYTKGHYSVIGIPAAGCKSYDTLSILNVWPNPVINLDHNADLCTGTTRTLQAGNYSSYLWQDGNTSPTIIVSAPGTYYVTVTDNNLCSGSDTVHIIRILAAPANFLPADTAICSYGSISIVAQPGYKNYLWSNNTSGSSITVTQPGLYRLEVIDNNNCKGKDSVSVSPKNCLKGFYIPTAFTPNNDGKNDLFKPFIFANIINYKFTVYNLFGQVVFESTDLTKGWNGSLQGVSQDTNIFAWICSYQIEGQPQEIKKGTVVLLR